MSSPYDDIPFDCHGDVPYDCKTPNKQCNRTSSSRRSSKDDNKENHLEELNSDIASGSSGYFLLDEATSVTTSVTTKEESTNDDSFESVPFDERTTTTNNTIVQGSVMMMLTEEFSTTGNPTTNTTTVIHQVDSYDDNDTDSSVDSVNEELEDSLLDEELPLPVIIEEEDDDDCDCEGSFSNEKTVSFQFPPQVQEEVQSPQKEDVNNITQDTTYTFTSTDEEGDDTLSYDEDLSYQSLEELRSDGDDYAQFLLDLTCGNPFVAETAMEFTDLCSKGYNLVSPRVSKAVNDCMTPETSSKDNNKYHKSTSRLMQQVKNGFDTFGEASPVTTTTTETTTPLPKPVDTTSSFSSYQDSLPGISLPYNTKISKSVVVIANDQDTTISSNLVSPTEEEPSLLPQPSQMMHTQTLPTTNNSKSVVVICNDAETISSNLVEPSPCGISV